MNRLSHLFRRKELYGGLAEEMRLHLEQRTEPSPRDSNRLFRGL